MSRLAAGVTVVSAVDADGARHGMTVNSLTSVSLQPLLVLFCCEKDASLHEPLLQSGRWAVSMLAASQDEVSRWFATRERRGSDQFSRLGVRDGRHTGAPILVDSLG